MSFYFTRRGGDTLFVRFSPHLPLSAISQGALPRYTTHPLLAADESAQAVFFLPTKPLHQLDRNIAILAPVALLYDDRCKPPAPRSKVNDTSASSHPSDSRFLISRSTADSAIRTSRRRSSSGFLSDDAAIHQSGTALPARPHVRSRSWDTLLSRGKLSG